MDTTPIKTWLGLTVFYDGWCPLCTGIKNRISKWDVFHLIRFVSIREQELIGDVLQLVSMEDLEKKMYIRIHRNQRLVSGIHSISSISLRIPVLLPLWPIFQLSSLIGIGQLLYGMVARSRKIIPVGNCTEEACTIVQSQNS